MDHSSPPLVIIKFLPMPIIPLKLLIRFIQFSILNQYLQLHLSQKMPTMQPIALNLFLQLHPMTCLHSLMLTMIS